MGGIFVTGSTTWLSLAEDRTAYGSRGVGITCSVELKGRLQNHLPGFEELSMLLPRREGGVYPGGFLALVSSCPSCLFLFRITVPFPAKSWALYLVTPGYLHIPWMGFPFRFCFLHYIITHSGKVIAWSRDDRGA